MKAKDFRAIRESLGLSRAELAEILGFASGVVISNIELGIRKPGRLAATVLRILKVLPKSKSEELIDLLRRHQEDKK